MSFRIGFIGGWGHHYLRGLLQPGGSPVEIEAAVGADGHDNAAARKWAEANGVSRWFDDPDQLMEQFEPDAVSIGSIYGCNSDLAVMALERGIPVVCDKPVAGTWQQLDRLTELAKKKPCILLTEFDFRAKPEFRAAHQAVANGEIGQPILVTAQKSYRFGTRPPWYSDRSQYTGTLLWIASHGVDAIGWVTGCKPVRVVGHQGNLSRPDYGSMEDHLSCLFALENGGTAVVHADFLRPAAAATHGDDRLRVAGSLGVVEVRNERCILITRDQGEMDITDRCKGVRPMHLELLAALKGDTTWFSTAASLETARVLLHARDAADGQCWVDL